MTIIVPSRRIIESPTQPHFRQRPSRIPLAPSNPLRWRPGMPTRNAGGILYKSGGICFTSGGRTFSPTTPATCTTCSPPPPCDSCTNRGSATAATWLVTFDGYSDCAGAGTDCDDGSTTVNTFFPGGTFCLTPFSSSPTPHCAWGYCDLDPANGSVTTRGTTRNGVYIWLLTNGFSLTLFAGTIQLSGCIPSAQGVSSARLWFYQVVNIADCITATTFTDPITSCACCNAATAVATPNAC